MPQLNLLRHRSNTVQILAQWQRAVASSVTLNLLHWAMGTVSYCLIRMAIELARKLGIFFIMNYFIIIHNPSYQTTMLWSIKIKAGLFYCSLLCE
jgi:hypothetical protein